MQTSVIEPLWRELDEVVGALLEKLTLEDMIRRAEGAGMERPLAEPISFSI